MKTSILVIILSVMCVLPALSQSTVRVSTGDDWDAALSADGQSIQLNYSGSRRVKNVKLKEVHPFTVGVDANNKPVRVLFSWGNLQYTTNSTSGGGKFGFAGRQWQMCYPNSLQVIVDVGIDHKKWYETKDSHPTIDLFGWGMWLDDNTAGVNPMKTSSRSDKDYLPKFQSGILDQQTAMGKNWRLPTTDEFKTLLGDGEVRGGKYVFANVQGVDGLVLLPDDWNKDFYDNEWVIKFSNRDWADMEAAGAVFLPGASRRDDTDELAVKYNPTDFWEYVRKSVRNPNLGYASWCIATVKGKQGWLWIPDNWTDEDYALFQEVEIRRVPGDYEYCTLPTLIWEKMYDRGAEFTPLDWFTIDEDNVYRYVDYIDSGKGYYWTSNAIDQGNASCLSFDAATVEVRTENAPRGIGMSVRMIRELGDAKEIVVADNASADEATIMQDAVTKVWSFTFRANADYEIEVEYDEIEVSVNPTSMMFTGGELKPEVTVKAGGVEVPKSEYTLVFPDDIINAGTKKIDIQNLYNNAGGYVADCNAKYIISKRELTVTPDSKSKKYGDPDPEFTYNVQGLLSGDQISGSLTRDPGENVGKYPIRLGTLTAGGNYSINFKSANLTIQPFEDVTLVWGETNFVYNGSQQVPTATLSGMKSGDVCTVTVTGAQTNAGSYKATATALSNPNYKLPADNTTSFTIAKADPVITPPEPVSGLMFTNKPHELITPGTTNGGTLMYNVEDLDYSQSLPKAVNVGDYIVHYYVEGNDNFNSSEVAYVTAHIEQSDIPVADDERILCDATRFCDGKASLSYLIVFGDVRSYTLKFESNEIPQQTGAIYEPEGDFEFSLPMTLRPGKYKGVVVFTDNLGKNSIDYPFDFEVNRIAGIIKQLYYNTLCADNSEQLFSSYQWTNGGDIAGEKNQYLHVTGGLKGIYTVWADMAGYGRYESCPFEPAKTVSSKKSSSVNVYPNPVTAHQEFTVRIVNYDIDVNYEIHIFNDMGGVIKTISDAQEYNQMSLPSGSYTGVLLVNGVKTGFKIIVK